jgi:peptidoglycan-N-acetylglucosamine deacetylase
MRTLLSQFGITTMFFVEGEFAERRPGDVRAILGDGHQIGNHTWDHPNLTSLSDDQIKQELSRTDMLIKKITGKSIAPNWRPPYGATNGRVQGEAAAVGFTKQWLWDVDSLDWKFGGDPSQIINQVETGLAKCPKQTCDVLFHDKSTTVSALRLLLPRLKQEGNKLVNFP